MNPFKSQQQQKEVNDIRYVARLDENWQKIHAQRVSAIESQLNKEFSKCGASEQMLTGLIAHDVALCEALAEVEVKLVRRLSTLIDNLKVAVTLARALRETNSCRTSAERRLQHLMQTRAILRGQTRLAEFVPLRRVA